MHLVRVLLCCLLFAVVACATDCLLKFASKSPTRRSSTTHSSHSHHQSSAEASQQPREEATCGSSWARATGVRVKKFLAFLECRQVQAATICMAQIAEVMSRPMVWLLGMMGLRRCGTSQLTWPVPALDLMLPEASVAQFTMQVLASLVCRPVPCSFPLWGHRLLDKAVAWVLFRMAMSGMASVWLRVHHRFARWDWRRT